MEDVFNISETIITLGIFFLVMFIVWFIYKLRVSNYYCMECGEEITTDMKIENCPTCGTRFKD